MCRLMGSFGPFPFTSLDEMLVTIYEVDRHNITMENRCQFQYPIPVNPHRHL